MDYKSMNEKIELLFSNQNISIEDKKRLMRLRKIYLNILKLKNYSELEKKMYNEKNDSEKVFFEICRILNKVNDSPRELVNLMQAYNLEKSKCPKADYSLIYDSIFNIEIKNDIKIALYDEFVKYYNSNINEYIEYYNSGDDEFLDNDEFNDMSKINKKD